jgi:hypothetical protein
LTFRLLAVGDGYTPVLSGKMIDPKTGPTQLTLNRHDLDKRDTALVLRGRVLDEDGKPVARAVVEPIGFHKGQRGQFGGLKGFDPLALTNDQGEFRLGVPEPDLAVYVQVSAPSLATSVFSKLPAGIKGNDLTLQRGVAITGRVVKDGKPLAGVAVGVVQKDRGVTTFVGTFQAATDADGVFSILNVPANQALYAYGLMDTLRSHGAITAREVRSTASGSVVRLGDLKVTAGHRLSGHVVLADGKPVPADTRVLLSREEAWDTQQAVVDKDGRFTFVGLPPEGYGLSVNLRGYHVSAKNASKDLLNGFQLLGVIDADIDELRFLLDPGPEPERAPWNNKLGEEYQRRRKAPLRGAPASP